MPKIFVASLCLCFKQCGLKTNVIPCCSYAKDKDNHERQQARSQDLEKRGGFFERVRKEQTTLIRNFIVLESESHGLFEK